MFDVLVDQPKKRYYLLLAFLCANLLLSVACDLLFGFDVMKASSFDQLLTIFEGHQHSFYGYFFYTLVTSPALYTTNVFYIVSQILYALLISFNAFDWVCILGLVGFVLSHKHKFSRFSIGLHAGYLMLRVALLMGVIFLLLGAFSTNDAILLLSRIRVVAFVVMVVHGFAFAGLLYYFVFIIRQWYLPLFKVNEGKNKENHIMKEWIA